MEWFQAEKIKKDVNQLFTGLIDGSGCLISVCRRCKQELSRCKCENVERCKYANHRVSCECVMLYNLIYDVAQAASEGKLKAIDGFLV